MRAPIVRLSGLPDEAAHAAPDYWRTISTRDKCRQCGVPRPVVRKLDGPIPVYEGTRSPLSPIWSIQPYLVGQRLYDAIRGHLPSHFLWRVVADRISAPLAPVGVLVRARYRPLGHCHGQPCFKCRACGQLKYPKGTPAYVVRQDLPRQPITMLRGGGFIAEQGFAEGLRKEFPRAIAIEPFEVRSAAPEPIIS
ncbi:MAG: hypothetical protein ACT4PL_15010 [Phycisphaerales bacterium]